MKRLLFVLIFLGFVIVSQAQISSIKIEPKKEVESVTSYDSLSDISMSNYKSLVGQTLFVKPTKKAKEDGYFKSLWLLKSPSVEYNALRYKPEKGGVDFSASSKYYEVLDVFDKRGEFDDYHFLKLRERDSGDILYYRISSYIATELMVLGYYEKQNKLYKGNKVVYKGLPLYSLYSLKDGSEIKEQIKDNTIFECKDVTFIEDKYYSMIYVLHNETWGDLYALQGQFNSLFKSYEQFLAEKEQKAQRKKQLIAKYGQRNGLLIFEGTVRIGFTKAMCKDAWGEPEDINTSTGSWGVHEQWCYHNGSYLYFENGKLTAIQN